jgi:hypothetical protein
MGLFFAACGTPTCSTGESCVQSSSHGAQQCIQSCAGLDAGGCSSGEVCTATSGCCSGTACSAIEVFVCCPASGC